MEEGKEDTRKEWERPPGTRKTRTARGDQERTTRNNTKKRIAERKKLITEGYAKGLDVEEALEYAEKIMRQRFRLKRGRS